MANNAFHPKDFKAWVKNESTNGDDPTITTGLAGLDVDSVSFPSLNVTQVANVRSGSGRVAVATDFFQDNKNRTVEVTLSGVLHCSGADRILMGNIMGSTADPLALAYNHTGTAGTYGVTTHSATTFTLVLASPDVVDGHNIVMNGCMVTNYQISADMGTDGGEYKYSATISSGLVPTLNDSSVEDGTMYTGSPIALSTLSTKKVYNLTPVMSGFSVTIDSPAVYAGFSSSGYEAFGRGEETSVVASSTVKLDSVTRGLATSFDTQSAHIASNLFTATQTTASDCSISIPSGVLTNVAYNEGDMMMLDVEMKALALTSGSILTIDVA